MKVIALIGPPNAGKTTTLKKLIEKLYNEKAEIMKYRIGNSIKNWDVSCSIKKLLWGSNNDVTVLIKCGGKIIIITTCGDIEGQIATKFKVLGSKCDCFVCAARPSGSSYNYVQKLAKTNTLTTVPKIGCKGDDKSHDFRTVANFSEELAINQLLNIIP